MSIDMDLRLKVIASQLINRLEIELDACDVDYSIWPITEQGGAHDGAVVVLFGSNDGKHGEARVPVCVMVDGDEDMARMRAVLGDLAERWTAPTWLRLLDETKEQDPDEGNGRALYVSLRHRI